jgi:hypothetical protein
MSRSLRSVVRAWLRAVSPSRKTIRRVAPRLQVEQLEDRLAPAVFTVNNGGTGIGSLPWAVGQANSNPGPDLILFDPTFIGTGQTIALSAPLGLTDGAQTTIQGPGAGLLTISGNNSTSLFSVSGTALLSGMKLTQGQSTQGGAINISSTGTLTLANCTLDSNTVTGSMGATVLGGAIYDAGTLTAMDCTLTNNFAGRTQTPGVSVADGGALYVAAGAGATRITNCTFDSNSCFVYGGQVNYGGTIYNGSSDPMTISNSSITNSSTGDTSDVGSGGAIYTGDNTTLAHE